MATLLIGTSAVVVLGSGSQSSCGALARAMLLVGHHAPVVLDPLIPMHGEDVIICKLRKKLAAAGGDNLIVTVRGRGYLLHEPAASQRMAADSNDGREAA